MNPLCAFIHGDEYKEVATGQWGNALLARGFPHLRLNNFLNVRQHNWCKLHLPYYTWTGQIVWFSSQQDCDDFYLRFLTPAMTFHPGERFALKLDSRDDLAGIMSRLRDLGAEFHDPPVWYGQELQVLHTSHDEASSRLWVVTGERGVLAAKMLDLEICDGSKVRGPSDAELDGMDSDVATRVMEERFKRLYGVPFPDERGR